jgi:hypothetical protein
MTAMSFNELMRKRDPRNFYRMHKQDDAWVVDDPLDPRQRPGDPIENTSGDENTVAARALRWLLRAGKFANEADALDWLINHPRGHAFLQRNAAHFGKRQRPAPKPAAAVTITSEQLVEAAKVHAVEKYGGPPDVAFVKLLQSDDGDGTSFRRVNAKLRHRELYGASASGPRPAFDAVTAKAVELRKADPKLSQAQAFAKAYADNPELRERERSERRRALGVE